MYKPGAQQKFLLVDFPRSCRHVSWCQWNLLQMTHYCANQHQVLDLHKAQSLKIKIEVHKHGFLTIGMQRSLSQTLSIIEIHHQL
jgi:hypothetical protein